MKLNIFNMIAIWKEGNNWLCEGKLPSEILQSGPPKITFYKRGNYSEHSTQKRYTKTMQQGGQVFVLNSNVKRESGRKAQLGNISAAKAVSDIIRTTLGPRSMLKMILDPMGGIVLTSDGNAILREIDVSHPAAKSMIELSRVQDDEVGDGTTSVIILAGEMLTVAEPYIKRDVHPTKIIKGFFRALEDATTILRDQLSRSVDPTDPKQVSKVLQACIGTKFSRRHSKLITQLAIDAVNTVMLEENGKKVIDTKRYARIEKIPGGEMEETRVLQGVMLNKDVVHAKMSRRIENPRILLLDCPLEYKKGESQTHVDMKGETDFETMLKLEEDYLRKVVNNIAKFKPDLVFTEKGVSDLAQHFLMKHNISAIRRVRKTDNNRIARAVGATIVHRSDEIKEKDIGTGCGLFDIRKIGDEYFTFLEQCDSPKACTIMLRGASKDVLNEIERNLHDAMAVVRNLNIDPRVVPGGGASEMTIAQALLDKSKTIEGVLQYSYQAVAIALEVIPRTLAQNCGADVVRLLTELRAKHAKGENIDLGIDGNTGKIENMDEMGIVEPLAVKSQTIKTAVESACLLLRIDDIVSGISKEKKKKQGGGAGGAPQGAAPETFGDSRDG
eukprot:gb/GECH01011656.1/.p1 GENE.gb/GECH01011656.1/~~gb/GECH01011656.1/.p1  ORF type:complete len:614 (+),score=145.76 gb/GECH01011656.1/:1-1842(+)